MAESSIIPARFAIYVGLLYTLGHALDLITTWRLSPDLSAEANITVSRFGFGWDYLLLSASLTSFLMPVIQYWLWKTMMARMPNRPVGYRELYGSMVRSPIRSGKHHTFQDALPGIACITTFAVLAAKWLTVGWNMRVLAGPVSLPIMQAMLVKNLVAAGFGAVVFFVVPWLLHRHKID